MSDINWDLAPEGAIAVKQDAGKWKNVTWVNDKGEWWDDTDASWNPDYSKEWAQTVAVRPVTQTKPVADESEKWTHVDGAEDKCFIIHTKGDLAWVSYERSICDCVVPFKDLRPIKPKLTEKEQKKVAKFVTRIYTKKDINLRKEFEDFCNEHEII